MNILSGLKILNNYQTIKNQEPLLLMDSPYWKPDHQDSFSDNVFSLVCKQRYIKPNDAETPMPYQHTASGIVAAGDLFLIERETLIAKLCLHPKLSDIELVTEAYLKWGVNCVQHLVGDFLITIWDKRKQLLFIATDHQGSRPCFYTHISKSIFYFSNILEPIKKSLSNLTINNFFFQNFVLDNLPGTETCYKEVFKLPAAHYLIVNQSGVQLKRYWHLKNQKQKIPYKKREDYYEAFREIFEKSVSDCLKSDYEVCAHISGGLDSSSVTSMAAHILAKSTNNKTLYAFTAIPNGLEGNSHRKNWLHHEMPKIKTILEQYPNITHHQYFSQKNTNMFETLSKFYPFIDQPYRNIFNFDWVLGSLEYAQSCHARTLLTGAKGNGSISWAGLTLYQLMRKIPNHLKTWLKPSTLFNGYFDNFNEGFLDTKTAKKILHQRGIILNPQYHLLSGVMSWPRLSSIRPVQLYYGINQLDPTGTLPIIEFCYNLPQWVYQNGKSSINKRLLVRKGLNQIVPESIRSNIDRGEQASDWYLQYNQHIKKWRKQLENLSPQAAELIWSLYDREKIISLMNSYSYIDKIDNLTVSQIRCMLMRCLSVSQFYEYLVKNN